MGRRRLERQKMEKDFTIDLPNEPYSNDYSLGKKVNAKYHGHRYLLIAVDQKTFDVEYVAERSDDNSGEFDLDQYHTVPNVRHVVVDAEKNIWEAAYLTKDYTHDEIPNYVYEHADGSTYEFKYAQETGVLDQLWLVNTIKYDLENDKIYRPIERLHIVSQEQFYEIVKEHVSMVKKELTTNSMISADDRQKLVDFQKWLEKLPRLYADVDHWKIPWPTDLPKY